MPEIEVSKETYNRILEDVRGEDAGGEGSLARYAGRWSNVSEDRAEEVKETLSRLREESAEKVV